MNKCFETENCTILRWRLAVIIFSAFMCALLLFGMIQVIKLDYFSFLPHFQIFDEPTDDHRTNFKLMFKLELMRDPQFVSWVYGKKMNDSV